MMKRNPFHLNGRLDGGWVTIRKGFLSEVAPLKALLEAEGLFCLMEGDHYGLFYRLLIPDSQAERAKEALSDLDAGGSYPGPLATDD